MPLPLFLPDAIKKGTLPTIIAAPKLARATGNSYWQSKIQRAGVITEMPKAVVPIPKSTHPPTFWLLLLFR